MCRRNGSKQEPFQGSAFAERVAQSPWCWDSAALPLWPFSVGVSIAKELFNIKKPQSCKGGDSPLLALVNRGASVFTVPEPRRALGLRP
jgi:hypothetical protein